MRYEIRFDNGDAPIQVDGADIKPTLRAKFGFEVEVGQLATDPDGDGTTDRSLIWLDGEIIGSAWAETGRYAKPSASNGLITRNIATGALDEGNS